MRRCSRVWRIALAFMLVGLAQWTVLHVQPASANEQERNYHGTAPAAVSLGGPFALTDHTGQAVSDKTFRGKWLLIYFGYVNCPDACPVALANLADVMKELGGDADTVRPLFVDFDFRRTTRKDLAAYVAGFHPRLVGLMGTRRQIFLISRSYKVRREHSMARPRRVASNVVQATAKRAVAGPGGKHAGGYRIKHTTRVYLVDPAGMVRAYHYHTLDPAKLAADVRKQLKQ